MPVEILEIVVRANVQEQENTPAASSPVVNGTAGQIDREKLIKECVTQVLEMMRYQRER
jgi:hypothetical protein